MKRYSYLAMFFVAISLFFASCSQDNGFTSLVPSNAYAMVRINQGEKFLNNLDEVVSKSPAAAQLGGMGIKSLLGLLLSTSPAKMTLADIDLTKPLGVALLPAETPEAGVGFAIYLPSKKPAELKIKLDALANEATAVFAAKDYAVITINAPSFKEAPKTPLTIRGNLTYADDEALVYIPAKDVLASFKTEWDAIKANGLTGILGEELPESLEGEEGEKALKLLGGFWEIVVRTVEASDTLVAYLKIDPTSLDFRSELNFQADSDIAKSLKDIPSGSIESKDFALLPDAHLFAMAMSMKPEVYKPLYQALIDAYLPILNLDEAQGKELKALLEESLSIYGEKLAASLDYKIDMAAIQAAQTEETPDYAALANAFSITGFISADISSADALNAYMDKSVKNPVIKAIMDKALDTIGMTGNVNLVTAQVEGKKYQQMSYDLVAQEGSDAENPEATALVANFLKDFKIAYLAEGKTLYMALPDKDNGASFKSFTEGKASDQLLGSNKAFADYLKNVSAGAQFIFRMNMDSLLAMVQNTAPAKNQDRLGMCGYLKIKGSSIEGGYSLGTAEIYDLVTIALNSGLGVF